MFVLIEQIKRGFNPSYFGGEWRQGTVTREKNCIYETAESGREMEGWGGEESRNIV